MPVKHAFGLTPWGRAFIEAIERLGDPGRLQRGRSYAGNGKVAKLAIEGGTASAKVRGSYQPWYRVSISFPAFSPKDRTSIRSLFLDDPLIHAQVSQGLLPAEFLDRMRASGIDPFPARWSDMKRSCDCPDYGDPCKHQAAVYYVIAQEIDRDPLSLFSLRGLDLATLLGANASPEANGEVPQALSDPLPIPMVTSWDTLDDAPAELSSLASYGALIPSILPPGPALEGLDLRLALSEFSHALASGWEDALATESDESRALAWATGEWNIHLEGRTCRLALDGSQGLSAFSALRAILAMASEEGSASYRFLRRLALALRSIVAAGAFYPQLLVEHGKTLSLVWKPASFGKDVSSALAWAAAAADPAFIAIDSKAKRGSKKLIPDRESLVGLMASSFLGDLVQALGFTPSSTKAARNRLAAALFSGQSLNLADPRLRGLDQALSARLSVYSLASCHGDLELLVKAKRCSAAARDAMAEPAYSLQARMKDKNGTAQPLSKAGAAGLDSAALAFPALLSSFIPGLSALGKKLSVGLSEEDLGRLVVETAPLLGRLGVSLILPKELANLARPRAVLRARKKGDGNLMSILDLDKALSFDWKIALGEELIDPKDFQAMIVSGRQICRFKQGFVRLDPAEAAALMERLARERKPSGFEAVKAALAGEVEAEGPFALAMERLFGHGRQATSKSIPKALKATLRAYQERGWRWILGNLERGLGCLLADDMGLGKTIQTIAAILSLKESGGFSKGALIIAPAGLLTNWERELQSFAPSLSRHVHYGAGRRASLPAPGKVDILLSSYETFSRDAGLFEGRSWSLAVLDEAHLIKNPSTKRCQVIKALSANLKMALSGTPVENNLAELWSIMDFCLPGYLGPLSRFAAEYRTPIEVHRSAEDAERLKRITSPFILRRLKTDPEIAPDLPDKIVIDEYSGLSPEQAALYEAAVQSGLEAIERSEGIERRGMVLGLMTALKQICNHPRNWDKESAATVERSGKARLLLAILESSMEAGERVLVFSQYVEMLTILDAILRQELGIKPFILHGGMAKAKRDLAVDGFQKGSGPAVFLMSLKAGGVGLNLTAATRVFHYDLWFNPAVEKQATDRAFRIGQTRNVFVHRLITRGSLEEHINDALNKKRELSELSLGSGETWIGELSDRELKDLFTLSPR